MADAVVSVVLEQIATILIEKVSKEVDLVRGVDQKVLDLAHQLRNVRSVLEDAEEKRFKKKNVRDWLVRLEGASYEMEDVLDEWHTALRKFQVQQQQQSDAPPPPPPKDKVCSFISCLCFQKVDVRRDIAIKIKNAKAKLDEILADKDLYGLVVSSPPTTTDPSSWRPQSISLVDLEEVHGRDIDRDVVASKIFVTMSPSDQVETEERQLETVSIVGVGGVGKTTLAQLVFSDSRVKDCFELAIWICVSDPFDLTEIIKKIVESVTRCSPDSNQLEVLVQLLKECISGKKFLLVLDDVWTEDHAKWERLKTSLKSCGGIGSKILVTTRNEKVAKTLDTLENGIHHLGVLSDESCWLLLKRIALFERDEEECAKYKDIGMKIVSKCKGLPLAAKTLGSLLRCKHSNDLEEWENVLKSEIWELEEARVDIFPHLLLSYNELSPALKRCFSYCAVFPKDSEIEVEEVIGHWMALGYLGSDIGSDGGDMELRGQQYFENLAMRSLFQDFQKDYWDTEKIKSFKLHDIVHDFAQFLRNNGTVVVDAGTNKKPSCQVCRRPYELVSQVKQYRTLLCQYGEKSPICGCLGSLRVLRTSRNSRIPQGIEKLIHLRWLDLSGNSDLSGKEGLETICNELYNLQTLSLLHCALEEIPVGIGNLINLRYLNLSWNKYLKELPSGIGNLINLRHLDLGGNESLKELPREIGKLIGLRHLNLSHTRSLKELARGIENLIKLRHLNLSNNYSLKELPREIGKLIHLRHLELSWNTSLKELPSEIGNLIHLRHLDLSGNYCLKELPKEIVNLINLRNLCLRENKSLKELPEIHRLVNLEHLANYNTPSIRQFPQGIAQLTRLRLLNEFRVGKDMGKLGWLKNLNRLGKDLKLVINLTGNMDVEDARDGELRNKKYLEDLDIVFDDEIDDGVEDCVWMDVIDALQPHPNLQGLTIHGFNGSRLPSWIASPLNKVKKIRLKNFSRLSSILMPLGKLPSLEELEIEKLNELKFVGREFLGITTETETGQVSNNNNNNAIVYFPNLKELTFEDCPKWEEWEDITAQDEDEKAVSFMPRLTQLNIIKCNSLKELPHRLLALSLEIKLDIFGSYQLESSVTGTMRVIDNRYNAMN